MFKKVLLSITVLFLTTTYSYAGNVQTFGIGANAMSQSEAVAAYSNDPFAVYYNPGGLVLNDKVTFTIGGMGYHPKIEIENFDDGTGTPENFRTKNTDVIIPHMGFSMPLNDNIFLGVAMYSPYGFHVKWGGDTKGAYNAYESYFGRIVVNPTLAYKLNEKLSFGFGVSLGESRSNASKVYTSATTLTLESKDDFNYSFNAGVMYRPVNSLSLGLTYRGRTDTEFKGDAFLKNKETGALISQGTVSMEFDHPESAQAGIRYFPTENFSVEFDTTWTRWSILEKQDIIINLGTPQTSPHPRNWEDTIQYKIGAEWKLLNNFALRAGYTYDPTPVPENTFDLGWPDTNRNVFNLGFGWNITENWTLDSVFQHVVSTSKREVSNTVGIEDVSLSSKGTLWGLGFTLSYSL